VGKDAYDDSRTEFYEETLAIVEKYEQSMTQAEDSLAPTMKQIKQGKTRLLSAMNQALSTALPRTALRGTQRELNPILADRWRDFMASQKNQAEQEATTTQEAAVRQLQADVLGFLLKCLDDVDHQLLLADWLPFDQLVKIKKGKQRLATALRGG
jgi:hypothetical protein